MLFEESQQQFNQSSTRIDRLDKFMCISLRHRLHHKYKLPEPLMSSYIPNKDGFLPRDEHLGHRISDFMTQR